MQNDQTAAPDSTAVRGALWRALHVQIDPPPHILEDDIGLRLVASAWEVRSRLEL
jgi:hypothetical protein